MGIAILLVAMVCIVGAVGLALVGFGVLGGNSERDQVEQSLASIERMQYSAKRNTTSMDSDPFKERVLVPAQAQLLAWGKRLTPAERTAKLRLKLEVAGNPVGWTVERIIIFKVLFLLVGAAMGFLLPLLMGAFVPMLVLVPLLGALGFYAPDLGVYQIAHNRTEEVLKALPDALDLLSVSVEAGLGFDAALSQVARNTSGPVAEEFGRVLQEMQIGSGRTKALRALADRSKVEDMQRFASAMVQADKLGIPITRVLRVQSQELRVKRRQRAQEQAQKLPVKILFPLMVCIMPALGIVIMGPAAISILDNFSNMSG
jgi:tight adherence protein C